MTKWFTQEKWPIFDEVTNNNEVPYLRQSDISKTKGHTWSNGLWQSNLPGDHRVSDLRQNCSRWVTIDKMTYLWNND